MYIRNRKTRNLAVNIQSDISNSKYLSLYKTINFYTNLQSNSEAHHLAEVPRFELISDVQFYVGRADVLPNSKIYSRTEMPTIFTIIFGATIVKKHVFTAT